MPGIPSTLTFNDTLGDPIPPNTAHAVSVSLPTWRSNVGYEEGEAWVVDKMQCGYPRFFILKPIAHLAECILEAHGRPGRDKVMLFPSPRSAARCKKFLQRNHTDVDAASIRILNLGPHPDKLANIPPTQARPRVSAVVYPEDLWPTAKSFWQHTGEGISSRRAEFCQRAFDEQFLVEDGAISNSPPRLCKGPKRYQRPVSIDGSANGIHKVISAEETATKGVGVVDSAQFVEERFGRNLDMGFAAQAKLAIRRRIAGSLTINADLPESLDAPTDASRERARDLPGFSTDDVYLFSTGMNSIFTAHQTLLKARGELKSVMFGFPYVDTLKILEKFGPGAVFYGHASIDELDELERRLEGGERFLSLFCEFPGNPLLKTPDLRRLRALADKYDFAVVVDETIGNFLNVHVLPLADVVVSSLTKVFSGDGNVMGGALILNPHSRYYLALKTVLQVEYEDNFFEEDSVYLERNSRDFVSRIQRINTNAEAVAELLRSCPVIKQVNYPKFSPTKQFYEERRLPDGGYGGLLSATFHTVEDAKMFYDHLDVHKGPSLGTNFTLASPFVLLAHYGELDWAAAYGCEVSLVRFSVGLEDTNALVQIFQTALDAVQK